MQISEDETVFVAHKLPDFLMAKVGTLNCGVNVNYYSLKVRLVFIWVFHYCTFYYFFCEASYC